MKKQDNELTVAMVTKRGMKHERVSEGRILQRLRLNLETVVR